MNYDVLMEEELAKLKDKKKILLHSCCGPCSTAVIERLKDYFEITILYYNPNIEPIEEYIKRKNEQIRYIKESGYAISFLDCDYDNESFKKIAKGLELELEGGARCHKCYYLRLKKTAELAIEKHFDYFGTTLTVSPYKNAKVINEMGLTLEKMLNENKSQKDKILFLVSDFKKKDGYKKSIELSRKYGTLLSKWNFICKCRK